MFRRLTLLPFFLSIALIAGFGASACAPSPEDVCSHLTKLAKKDVGEKLAKKATEGCVKRWKRAKEMKGYFKYRKTARCVVSKKSFKDIKDCK